MANSVQPLPAWVGFQGKENSEWKARTTEEWPIQKFSWKNLTAACSYDLVPMVGKPGGNALTYFKAGTLWILN
jgi:hypothetical protein